MTRHEERDERLRPDGLAQHREINEPTEFADILQAWRDEGRLAFLDRR